MSTLRDDDVNQNATTVRDDSQSASGTVRDGADAPLHETGTTHRDSAHEAGQRSLMRLPEALARRFWIVEPLPTAGSEADLLVVESETGERFVAKLYRTNVQPKSDVLETVSNGSPEHVIRLYEHGQSEGVWYELLEYARFGSLREIIAKKRASDALAQKILSELATAIAHLHQLGIIHRDLKPENVLVRTREPLDLILTDFGIASLAAGTIHFTSSSRTVRYGAPESASGAIGPSVDYWALGMVLVEALTGQHPFEGLSEASINNRLATRPVDMSGVPEHWRRLCSGLLIRDPKNRWGADQLKRWLAGARDIPVADDIVSGTLSLFPFEGGRYSTMSELVPAFAQHWDAAVKAVERGNLSVWLQKELRDFDTFNFIEDQRNDTIIDKDERLFLIIAKFCPQLPPIWKGRPLDRRNLIAMATPADQYILHEVFTHRLLSKYDNLVGTNENSAIEKPWRELIDQLQAKWRELGTRKGPIQKKPDDAALAAAALLIVMTPAFVDRLKVTADQWLRKGARNCSWCKTLGDTPADLLIIGIVGKDAIKDIERIRAETAAAESARRAEKKRLAQEGRYEYVRENVGNLSGIFTGALAGLVVGFIPCWIVSGIIGIIFSGWPNGETGWNAFWWLWIASLIVGALSLCRFGPNWVASSSREPDEVIAKGVLITGVCSVLSILFIYFVINSPDHHVVGSGGPSKPITSPTFTNVEFVEGVENGQPIAPSVSFVAPASPSIYATYVNGRVGVDKIAETLWSGTRQISRCNELIIQYQNGNFSCPVSSTPLDVGSYSVQVTVNGQLMGTYSFTVTSSSARYKPFANPSFNCMTARKWAEAQVCSNSALADSDRQMASSYKGLISSAAEVDRTALRTAQRQWIETRDLCEYAADPMTCLKSVYTDRISTLSGVFASAEALRPADNAQKTPNVASQPTLPTPAASSKINAGSAVLSTTQIGAQIGWVTEVHSDLGYVVFSSGVSLIPNEAVQVWTSAGVKLMTVQKQVGSLYSAVPYSEIGTIQVGATVYQSQ